MKNLISYEFRNSKKSLFSLITIMMIASFVLQGAFGGIYRYEASNVAYLGVLNIISVFAIILSIIVFWVTSVLFTVRLANIFKDDFYTDKKYVIFSLPRTNKQIINSKLVVSLIWILISISIMLVWNTILFVIINVLLPGSLFKYDMIPQIISEIKLSSNYTEIKEFFNFIFSFKNIALFTINYFVSIIYTIMIMYFSIVYDYKRSRNKTNSHLWIIYAIMLSIITNYVIGFMLDPILGKTLAELGMSFEGSLSTLITQLMPFANSLSLYIILDNVVRLVLSALIYVYVLDNYDRKLDV